MEKKSVKSTKKVVVKEQKPKVVKEVEEKKENEEIVQEVEENDVEIITNEVDIEEMPKKQHQMFHNLEEERMVMENKIIEQKEAQKIKEQEELEKQKSIKDYKPKLQCPWCSNIQYELNSKDITTAWCGKCGRAFMAEWK